MIKTPAQSMRADLTRGDFTDFRAAGGQILTGRVMLVTGSRIVIEAGGAVYLVRAA